MFAPAPSLSFRTAASTATLPAVAVSVMTPFPLPSAVSSITTPLPPLATVIVPPAVSVMLSSSACNRR